MDLARARDRRRWRRAQRRRRGRHPLRFRGGGTKLAWGARRSPRPRSEISTAGLERHREHNAGDLTAVIEAGRPARRRPGAVRAGGPDARARPAGPGGATVGGVVATGDTGPLRARYGGPRDLVVGIRWRSPTARSRKSGGKVIKNVAGYDLAKLFTGSFGTLGAIVELSVRLHPIPA